MKIHDDTIIPHTYQTVCYINREVISYPIYSLMGIFIHVALVLVLRGVSQFEM